MCVIADKAHVLGLGGVMGGETTGATEGTTTIFIESAYFDPVRTAATGRKTGINSDARFRFERGIDPHSEMTGLNLATKMILDFCGGEPGAAIVAGREPDGRPAIRFDPARVQKLSGANFSNAETVATLKKLGFEIAGKAPALTVTPPSPGGRTSMAPPISLKRLSACPARSAFRPHRCRAIPAWRRLSSPRARSAFSGRAARLPPAAWSKP